MTSTSVGYNSLADKFSALLRDSGAPSRSVELFIRLRGLGGDLPKSLRSLPTALSAERVRQLIVELESGPLQSVRTSSAAEALLLRDELDRMLRRIEAHAPGADEDIREAIATDYMPLEISPASVVRIADLLGVHHGLRLTTWTERPKFEGADRKLLAAGDTGHRRVSLCGIVPDGMPEVFESFVSFARKFSRGAGVVAAGHLAECFGVARGLPIAQNEAVAYLRPFAVHLGRHNGDDWFAFFNSANDFIRKATARVDLFGHASFAHICQFHQRFNRSLYANEDTAIPEEVLKAALELAGFEVDGDRVASRRPKEAMKIRGVSDIQAHMVRVFRELIGTMPGRTSIRRADLVKAMLRQGIRESTARIYLGNQGIFECKKGLCRLADCVPAGSEAPAVPAPNSVKGRSKPVDKMRLADPAGIPSAPAFLATGISYPDKA